MAFALVEGLAPVDDDFLPDLSLRFVRENNRTVHDPRLAAEFVVREVIALGTDRPGNLLLRALPEALCNDIAVARIRDMEHVRPRVHAAVRDKDEPTEPVVSGSGRWVSKKKFVTS